MASLSLGPKRRNLQYWPNFSAAENAIGLSDIGLCIFQYLLYPWEMEHLARAHSLCPAFSNVFNNEFALYLSDYAHGS